MLQEYLECRCADLDSCRDAGGLPAEMIGNKCSFMGGCLLIMRGKRTWVWHNLVARRGKASFPNDWKSFRKGPKPFYRGRAPLFPALFGVPTKQKSPNH